MSSNIDYTTIDDAYPVAGQDNNTQGFRDNFSAIKTAIETAKSEIETLQTKSVLNSSLTGSSTTINDLNGSTISDGLYNQMYGVVHRETTTTTADINLHNGPLQVFTLMGNATLTFTNWPTSIDQYSIVRVHLKSDTLGSRTPTLTTANAGTIYYDTTPPFTLNSNGHHTVIEAWTYDSGTHVYIKYIGEFS